MSNRQDDVGKTKRWLSSFLHFSKDQRQNVRADADQPNISFHEVSRKLGEMWRKMTPEEKAPYVALSKIDKERYDNEMKDYLPTKKEKRRKQREDETEICQVCGDWQDANKMLLCDQVSYISKISS
jgi:hypothetical protein